MKARLGTLLVLTALSLYCEGSLFNKALECKGPICFNPRGYIHHRPDPTTNALFKEWSIIESSPELTNILIKFRIPEDRPSEGDDHFVILASSKHQWSEESYVAIEPNEKVVLFTDVTDVTIAATTNTEFYLEYYSGCVAVDREAVMSDENLSRNLLSDVPDDFQSELCWVVLPESSRSTKIYESGPSDGESQQMSFSTFNDVKDEAAADVLNGYLERAMNLQDKSCLEMEINNLKCYLNITEGLTDECSGEAEKCDEVDKMLLQQSFEIAVMDAEVRSRAPRDDILNNLHPVRTRKIWRYLFRSDCDNFRRALFDKRSTFRNAQHDHESWMHLLRLRYFCNEKFNCRAFGPCRTTCRFVRSLKSLKDTIGFDVCDPNSASQHLSMF